MNQTLFPKRPLARSLMATVAASLCSLLVSTAWAQSPSRFDPSVDSQSQGERAGDPAGRVGRLASMTGQVWMFSPDAGDWMDAVRNHPLTTGDRLSTDAGARAEVRIGSTTVRMDSATELEVLRLDDDRVVLQLHSGSVTARLRNREAAAEFELTTEDGRFTLARTGRYRFDRIDETSGVTVYNGQSQFEGPGTSLSVYSGQRAEFWVDAGNVPAHQFSEPVRDPFASWAGERDRGDDRSAASRYVSPEMTGVEDLDRYGRWDQSDEYGALWVPRTVAVGWAPYSSGHWAWVRPWGWTWVDDAPWGFAPFHYGRWVWFRSVWCWAPGTYVARPVYAPALVAWVGGPRVSVSINIGGGPAVGWLPLAPREVYVPSYRVSPRYITNINITHVRNVGEIDVVVRNPQRAVPEGDYANRRFPHAVTVVPTSIVVGRQPVGEAAARYRDAPGVREFIDQPGRVSAPVVAPAPPPVAPRADAQAQPPRSPRFRDRDGADGGNPPRVPANGDVAPPRAAVEPRAPAEARPREPAAVVTPRTVTTELQPPAQPAQPVPPRPQRVMPNPPVTPRTDVPPLPPRQSPAAAAPPARPTPLAQTPQPAQPARPAEPPQRVQPPVRRPAPPAAAAPDERRGREDDPEWRRRHREVPQREGSQVN